MHILEGTSCLSLRLWQRQRRLNQSSGISSAARAGEELFHLERTHLERGETTRDHLFFQLQCLLFYTIFDSSAVGKLNLLTPHSFRWPFCVLLRLLGLNVWPRGASSKPWLHFNLFFLSDSGHFVLCLWVSLCVCCCVGKMSKKKGFVLKKNAFQRDIKC